MKQRGNIFWKRTLTCVLALMLALTGCGSPGGDLMAGVRGREKESQVDLNGPGAQAAADFSIKLLNAALEKNPGQNALFSPLSALCALAMTANGADGDTLAELEALLGGEAALEELSAPDAVQEAADNYTRFFELAKQYTHLEQLDRDTLLTFVERIEIGPKVYENGGHKVPARANQPYRQSVRIFYKFIGELTENSEKCSDEKPA